MWPLRIALSRFRPFGAATAVRTGIVLIVMSLFLAGDFALFRRLFRAIAQIESLTPFFAVGLLENLMGMVFLVASVVLFFSAMTAAIGAFFSDLDLDLHHSAPRPKGRLAIARLGKTFIQSSYLVVSFLIPLFAALAAQYRLGMVFIASAVVHLLLLLIIPVACASSLIIVLIRTFPARRVHQITVTLAILMLTVVVVGFRMMRPERLFTEIATDELTRVLSAIEMPASQFYPSGWLAEAIAAGIDGKVAGERTLALAGAAAASLLLFLAVSRSYFKAFVRARESLAPPAIGAGRVVTIVDRLIVGGRPPTRAMVGKEVRILTRDVAQWSQMFMMAALLFLYLYNIRTLPLEGDMRAILVAYANLGMAGFVVSAICLRFAYPSISAEGKSFWILQTAPVSYRKLLWIKALVFGLPLVCLALFLAAMGNLILHAPGPVWIYTLAGSVLMAMGLVTMGVGMGGVAPNFAAENPLEVGLSLGGLAYMATSMVYVGALMFLMARPVQRFLLHMIFGITDDRSILLRGAPLALAVGLCALAVIVPMEAAGRRLALLSQRG